MTSQFTFFLILATLLVSCEHKPLFELLEAEQTGISFVNAVEETDSLHILNFEYLYNGAGVGIMDLDNDGFQDILFTGNQVSPRVYLNEGDFHFRDISSRFDGLDDFLVSRGIHFNLHSEAYCEYDAENVYYRGGQTVLSLPASQDGDILIRHQDIVNILDDNELDSHGKLEALKKIVVLPEIKTLEPVRFV